MSNFVGLAIFGLGIVLLIYGFSESETLTTEIARLFAGNGREPAVWMILLGVLSVLAGLGLAVWGTREAS